MILEYIGLGGKKDGCSVFKHVQYWQADVTNCQWHYVGHKGCLGKPGYAWDGRQKPMLPKAIPAQCGHAELEPLPHGLVSPSHAWAQAGPVGGQSRMGWPV